MAILAEGGITLTSVNDACSVLLSPSSCVIHADYDGSNPILNTAFTDINVIRGNVKLPITPSNISVIAKSDSEIVCAFQTVNSFTQRLLITYLPSTILNGSIQIQVTYDSLIMTPTFVFSVERESTMLAWIQDWETRKTQIGSEYIITPKFFAGKKEADNSLTGVYVGPDANGAGIYGYQAGKEIFHLNEIGGSIGGWNIQNGGISTSDGKLRILSEGSIISLNSDDEVIYGLYKTGEATFAKGNVLFHADGSASFKGSITAEGGSIAGWNIASRAIWKNHILLDSLTNYIGLGPAEITNANLADNTYSHRNIVQTSGGISMFYTSANAYGIEGYLPAVSGETKLVFKLGDVNKIAGWTFDVNSLVSNYVTLTNQTNNAGVYFSADDISEVAGSGLSAHINAGTGAYIKAGSGVVELAGVVDGATVFKMGTGGNQIAGWSFSNTAIWTGNATVQDGFTTTANSMVLTGTGIYGYKWGLNADGSGKLAGGKIAWTVIDDICQVDIDGVLSTGSIDVSGTLESCMILSKTIMVRNASSQVNAGMSAEGTDGTAIRFWAGGTYENRASESTPFRVLQNGKFYASNAEITGKITATSGTIGGWMISGYSITNQKQDGSWNSDSAIIFRDDPQNIFVAIGTSVLPSSSALTALARFENEQVPDDFFGTATNYGVIFSVKNASYNFAFCGSGSGVLDGYIAGYGIQIQECANNNTVYDLRFKNGDTIIIKASSISAKVMLPPLDAVQSMLSCGQNVPFHIQIKILYTQEKGYYKIPIYPKTRLLQASATGTDEQRFPWDNAKYPTLLSRYNDEYGYHEEITSNPLYASYMNPLIVELFYDGDKYWAIHHWDYVAPYVSSND